jgi:hypothetical protein
VLRALGALPVGSAAAGTVLAELKSVCGVHDSTLAHVAWLRHLPACRVVTLSHSSVRANLDALAGLPQLAELRVSGASGDIRGLTRLTQVRALRFTGDVALGTLVGHPSLVELHVDGLARDVEALADIPTLRVFGVSADSVDVTALLARVAARLPLRLGQGSAEGCFTLTTG